MSSGYPDFTYKGVTDIIAQTIGNLAVDIKAQTLANLAVDIAAQTLATLGVNIKAQDLASVAIDIAAQTLSELAIKTTGATKVAIDISAQTLAELAIKTTGATKVAIDIAAQTLSTLGINITAQSLAELVIKIAAQSVGVYVERDWEALQNNDKSLSGTAGIASGDEDVVLTYTVTAGKIFYIDDFQLSSATYSETNISRAKLRIDSSIIWMHRFPGGYLAPITFTTPKRANAGQVIDVLCYNTTVGTVTYSASIGGREVDA